MAAADKPRSRDRFRFKHFELSNASSSQKVGTDGVITGAYASHPNPKTIWDVGSGTGLIALMLAQRFTWATIHAIEIDSVAAEECRNNAESSPWSARINVVEGDINRLANTLPKPDLIVSNPPFFATTGEKSPDPRRAMARHDGSLSPESLIRIAARYIAPGGSLIFIAPFDRNDEISLSAELARMETVDILDISSRDDRVPIRRVWTMMRRGDAQASSPSVSRISIRNSSQGYPFSTEYKALTSDFYLDF